MAVNYDPVLPGTPDNQGTKFVAADGTAEKDITPVAPAEGMIVRSLALTQNSAISRNVTLYAYDGATSYRLGTKVLSASAGAGSTPADDLMSVVAMTWITQDIAGNKVYVLKSGWNLRASLGTTMDASNDTTIVAEIGLFTKQA
jgi:hypothetical protein